MSLENLKMKSSINDIVTYLNELFDEAIRENVSDIHIEPNKDFLLVRFRKDGGFIIKEKISMEESKSLLTRIKVMSKLKIDENKKPQDGKIFYESQNINESIDIRVSTLPITEGEKVVLRILRQNEELIKISNMNFLHLNSQKIKNTLESKYGIVLIAGPTGSGKSTSLFSLIREFNPLEYNISTLEDPIEYNIKHVNQSQIRPEIGYTFASGLRTLVRQDPDIIMVGEIRDKETASLSIEAALTGHLVLSTIHTNSAASTIQRLINMGLEPFLISSALKMVISQRLVRKICNNCKVNHNINEEVKNKINNHLSPIMEQDDIDNIVFFRGEGCDKCNQTGYSGRTGVHEVLVIEDYLEKYILEKSSAKEIEKRAIENGMITIIQDALLKAAMGQTSVEEALKLT